jgi:hypothetical protein
MHKFQKVTKFDETINADESTDICWHMLKPLPTAQIYT